MTALLAVLVAGLVALALTSFGRTKTSSTTSLRTTTTSAKATTTTKGTTRPSVVDPKVVQAQDPVPSGTWAVRSIDVTVVDHSRIAVVDGVQGPRRIGVRLLVPTSDQRVRRAAGTGFPLVVFAPGYLQCRSRYAPLLDRWASAGFVVAALAFPLTSCRTPGKPEESDILNQPADVAFVIQRLAELAASGKGPLADRLEAAQVALAGHSDGADTVLADLANTCCLDRAAKAGIVMAGAELASFPGRYFAGPTVPILFVQGSADTINIPANTERAWSADETGPRWLLDISGGGHFGPYQGDGPEESIVASVTTAFLDAELKADSEALGRVQSELAHSSSAKLVHGAEADPLGELAS